MLANGGIASSNVLSRLARRWSSLAESMAVISCTRMAIFSISSAFDFMIAFSFRALKALLPSNTIRSITAFSSTMNVTARPS